jgi:hypothetical protein
MAPCEGGVQSESRDWWFNALFGTLAVGAKKLETRQQVANVAQVQVHGRAAGKGVEMQEISRQRTVQVIILG